jgi:hypothetical protein
LTTQAFEKLGEVVAAGAGLTQLKRVTLPHPLNPLSDEEIKAAARAQLHEVLGCLLVQGAAAPAPAPASRTG